MIRIRLAAFLAFAGLLSAATSSTWDTSSSSDFLRGRLKGLSVTPEGWLQPGPALAKEIPLNEPVLWTLIPAGEGGAYAATGHTGKVYYIDRAGKSTLLWTADQPEVFALCTDSKGRLYAGTSPNGGVYRIDEGKVVEVAHLGTKYIWALAATADDSIFAATGDGGKVFRIDSSGQAQLYFDTGQSNVTSLALGYGGHLYAGTDPNGLLYDITGPAHGTALYRSSLPEIHSVAVEKNGTIFASALGGSLTSRTATPASATTANATAVVAATPTVISVSEAKENGIVPEQNADIKIQAPKGTATSTITSATAAPTPAYTEVSGVEKSAIYRLSPDGAVDTLRTSKEENVFKLLPEGEKIWFSTDVHGRLYSLAQNRQQILLTETGDGDANSLVRTTAGVWVGLSNPARVALLSSEAAAKSIYESPVHDVTTFARWGKLSWKATAPGISFQTRTGNTGRPDATWSNWSAPISSENAAAISSPKSRYIQWRAEWPAGSSAQLWSVTVPFLPQNSAPVVRSISITSVAAASAAKTTSGASSSSGGAYTITVTDTGDASSSTSGTATQTANRPSTTQTQLTWQADDPDNDKLIYSVFFRGEGEQNWTLLRKDLFDNTLLLDADALADGRYLFKVIASDKPANDLRYAAETELVSSPVLIDNTPPVITAAAPQRNGSTLELAFSAEDKGSALRRCEYSVDAGIWQPLEATDGITDSKQENFKLQISDLKSGEHVLTIRVYDSAGNAGLARIIVR